MKTPIYKSFARNLRGKYTAAFLLGLLCLVAADARNPGFAFTEGDTFATGVDPGALLSVLRSTTSARSASDLYVSSYRDGSVLKAGRSDAGFVGPLNAVYFDERDFKGKRAKRKDAVVDFDWGNDGPLPGFGKDSFSVRWTGSFRAERSGRYRFTTESDDGVRLWINDKKIIDRWHDMAPAFHSGEIALQGGRSYQLRLDYYENGGGAVARLFWQPPGATKRTLMRRRGGFAPQSTSAAGLGARALATGDINGDGLPDLAVANYNYAGTVTLLLAARSSGFRTQTVTGIGDDPIDLALADLNGDERPELIVLNRSSADLRIFPHIGDDSAADNTAADVENQSGTRSYDSAAHLRIPLPAKSGPAEQLQIADINGDRRADLLMLAGDLYFVLNNGGSKSNAGDETNKSGPTSSPAFRLTQSFRETPRALVDDAKFAEDRRGRRATSFAAADLDRDGDTDIAVAFADGKGRRAYLSLLRNSGASQAAPAFIRTGHLSALPGAGQETGETDAPAAAGFLQDRAVVRARDLDGDGLVDLAFNHSALPGLSVYRNTSRPGKFSPNGLRPQKFPALPAPATDLRLADLNGDGKLDVAVLHGGTSQASVYFAR